MAKDAAFYRHLADRCRELIAGSSSSIAKDQFELWLTEFEAQADAVEEAELAAAEAPNRRQRAR